MIIHLKKQTIEQISKEFKEIVSFLSLDYPNGMEFDFEIIIKNVQPRKDKKS